MLFKEKDNRLENINFIKLKEYLDRDIVRYINFNNILSRVDVTLIQYYTYYRYRYLVKEVSKRERNYLVVIGRVI